MSIVAALALGAQADVIAPGAADFAYEGNDIPPGGGWDHFVSTMAAGGWNPTDSISGGAWVRNVNGTAGSVSTEFMFARKDNMFNDLTFTVDWRVARPVNAGSGVFQADGPNLDILVDLDGPGGSDLERRLIVNVGDARVFSDYSIKDILTIDDGSGSDNLITVPGLNVDDFNIYRVVGLGDGSYKVYVNDIVAPVAAGNLQAAVSDSRAGQLYTTWQVGLQVGSLDADMRTDYIRVLNDTAIDERPIPEPASALLLLIGGGLLAWARRRYAGTRPQP